MQTIEAKIMHEHTLAMAARARLARDPQRPGYHFTAPANWLNDPNGLIHWKGRYHLFYQYNPLEPVWGVIHWGHAVSDDLVHWDDLPIALAPTPDSQDEGGCWSGCIVDNNGVPTMIYTGARYFHGNQLPCVATSADDNLVEWTKYAANPVIAATPPGVDQIGFRDHTLWRDGDLWVQGIGSGVRDVGGTVLLYTSPDLIHWDYVGPLITGNLTKNPGLFLGTLWECPQFFQLGDKHVLLFSAWDGNPLYSVYMIGTYRDHRFHPESVQKIDFGDTYFYAPQTMVDASGRTLVWGWIQEGRGVESQRSAGWSGVMSLPRVLSLHEDGALRIQPASELQKLRREYFVYQNPLIGPDDPCDLPELKSDQFEIVAEFEVDAQSELSLLVRRSPYGLEQTQIFYNAKIGQVGIERHSAAPSDAEVHHSTKAGAFQPKDSHLRLHVFVDRSVIEVFVNERVAITSRVYPEPMERTGVAVMFNEHTSLVKLEYWKLDSIFKF